MHFAIEWAASREVRSTKLARKDHLYNNLLFFLKKIYCIYGFIEKDALDMVNTMKIIKLETVHSTHLYALDLIDKSTISPDCEYASAFDAGKSCSNSIHDCAIMAENQTNGIGRCNRVWKSLQGNLFASIIKKLPKNADLGGLSLTAACAVRDTIESYMENSTDYEHRRRQLRLHWPNDVYYDDRKASGILMAISNGYMITSVGINVNSAPCSMEGSSSRSGVSIVDILERKTLFIEPENVLLTLLKNIEKWFWNWNNVGFAPVRSYWLRNIKGIKHKVTIKNGSDSISGIFADIDESGRLVLDRGDGSLYISSGDLFVHQERVVIQNE
jgi:BirA family biotin operon repressor/biotin-[acetyl-CoA-carboxylase] ligase